jgi:ribokinase
MASARELAQRLAVQNDVPTVIVTLGSAGCVVHSVGGGGLFPAEEVAVVDATGASDAFTATLAAHLTAGAPEAEAVDAAQRAAALAIQRPGGHESMPV